MLRSMSKKVPATVSATQVDNWARPSLHNLGTRFCAGFDVGLTSGEHARRHFCGLASLYHHKKGWQVFILGNDFFGGLTDGICREVAESAQPQFFCQILRFFIVRKSAEILIVVVYLK